jgi:hypothetical protein
MIKSNGEIELRNHSIPNILLKYHIHIIPYSHTIYIVYLLHFPRNIIIKYIC